MKTILLVAQLLLASTLMWTCFCRLVKTDADTHREVRWSILFEGIAAGLVMGAPYLPLLMPREIHWMPFTTPLWVWVGLLVSVTLVQVVTARYWKDGTCPAPFQRTGRPLGGVALAGLALLVAGMTAAPRMATADAAAQDNWRKVDGDMVQIPQGGEVRCLEATGCVVFTTDALREVLKRASGTCGRIPELSKGKDT